MKEKRKYPRFEFPLEVKYSCRKKAGEFSYTVSHNFSRGGICLPVISKLAKDGDILNLEIRSKDRDIFNLSGKVKWARDRAKPALLERDVGIEFAKAKKADLDRLTGKIPY